MLSNRVLAALAVILCSALAYGHKDHHHESEPSAQKEEEKSSEEKQLLEQINLSYQKTVKPIFQAKCMTCHSSQTEYPFYYNWPIAKKIIDDDVAESKKHLDMTNGFPFAGHGTPVEDLEAIKKVTDEGSMPPFRYRIMHWDSGLTEAEKNAIDDWTGEGIKLLQQKP